MKTALIIYGRAIGLFAILMLPGIALSAGYLESLKYVFLYGWFACIVFILLYLVINRFLSDIFLKLSSLFAAVAVAVAFAYQMLGTIEEIHDIWSSRCIIFPFAALIAGWISLCFSFEKIKHGSIGVE